MVVKSRKCFISYRKLFVLLDERMLAVSYLYNCISSPTVSKLRQNKIVRTDVIVKVCDLLGVQPGDIMELKYSNVIERVNANE